MNQAIVAAALYPLFFLFFEVESSPNKTPRKLSKGAEDCKTYPEDKVIKLIYSAFKPIELKCDTSESASDSFRWDYYSESFDLHFPIYVESEKVHQYRRSGTDKDSRLVLGWASKDKSGFYCCQTYPTEDGKKVSQVSKMYAVLAFPGQLKLSLKPTPNGPVEKDTEVTLKCGVPLGVSMKPSIEPIIDWKVPKKLSKPSSKDATEYKFTANADANNGEFQCILKYPGAKVGEAFPSNIVVAQFLDSSSTTMNLTEKFVEDMNEWDSDTVTDEINDFDSETVTGDISTTEAVKDKNNSARIMDAGRNINPSIILYIFPVFIALVFSF